MIFRLIYEIIQFVGGDIMYKWISKLSHYLILFLFIGMMIGFYPFKVFVAGLIFLSIFSEFVKKLHHNKVKKEELKHQRHLDEQSLLYFNQNDILRLNENIEIRFNHADGFDDLDVYYKNEPLCKVKEFKNQFKETYHYFENALLHYEVPIEKNIKKEDGNSIDDSFLKQSLYKIERLNIEIEHSKIKEDLYHTATMIKFIIQIVEQYPHKIEKLSKLENFYLPTLISILENYTRLLKTNRYDKDFDEVEAKLIKTIYLVNEALTNLSETLCDDEILDLSSDMSVLETMLKRDGLVKEGTLDEFKK